MIGFAYGVFLNCNADETIRPVLTDNSNAIICIEVNQSALNILLVVHAGDSLLRGGRDIRFKQIFGINITNCAIYSNGPH